MIQLLFLGLKPLLSGRVFLFFGVFQSWSVLVIQGLFYLLRHDEEDHLLKCLGSEMIGCEKTTNVHTGMASG